MITQEILLIFASVEFQGELAIVALQSDTLSTLGPAKVLIFFACYGSKALNSKSHPIPIIATSPEQPLSSVPKVNNVEGFNRTSRMRHWANRGVVIIGVKNLILKKVNIVTYIYNFG